MAEWSVCGRERERCVYVCVWAAEWGRPAWRALWLVFVITAVKVKHISRHADGIR